MGTNPQAIPSPGDGAPGLFSLRAVGRRWSVCNRTLYRKIEEGKLRVIRLGGLFRISREEVERVERDGF